MRILRIITRLNVGGPAIHTILLSKVIQDTLLCHGGLAKDEESILINEEMNEKHLRLSFFGNTVYLPLLQRELNLIKDWKAFWQIRKLIKKYRPDIIHTHMAKAGFLGRLAGISVNLFRRKKIRLVHTFHGHTFYGYFSGWKTRMFLALERWLGKRSTIVCLSHKQQDDLIYRYKVTRMGRSWVIPLGLELEKFRKLPQPAPCPILNVAIIGRLSPVKNHKMLFDAIKIIKKKGMRSKYNFYIVGKGESEMELIDYANELGINDCVIWWGWEKDIADFYQGGNIHVVVNTSLNEGTPVSLIEAIVAGRGVICADFDGAFEFLMGNLAGILVKRNDAEMLADKIMRYNGSRVSERTRDIFYERYSFGRLGKDICELYARLID